MYASMILIRNRRPICFLSKFEKKKGLRKQNIFVKHMNEYLKYHFKTGFKVLTQGNSDLRILAATLFLCKLEDQDVKIDFGIHHGWTQNSQIG